MSEPWRTRRVGAASVTIVNVGDIQGALSGWMDEPPGGWPAPFAARLTQVQQFPIHCVHIGLPGLSVLVDAGLFDAPSPDSPYFIPAYQPPPPFQKQLAQAGVRLENISHVVITHAHGDHFNGLTMDGRPVFPNARCYLGRADWERAEMQKALQSPQSTESRTFGVLAHAGLMEAVEGDRALGDGVQIIAAPGETPGHQIVRVHSEGQTLYCVGDLYHDPVEADQPTLMVRWADPKATLASRRALAEAALAENALLVATHIPAVGRLRDTGAGVVWAAA
ncbi:MAG: MBL fold metallo-hydrolase [Chloroflexi bacterium]|nr:MBL fold metallo-hydrolase [Chloroflexota bacterium]